MEPVGIPRFDEKNALHKKLALLSKELHQKKAEGREMDCAALEGDVEAAVCRVFGIKAD